MPQSLCYYIRPMRAHILTHLSLISQRYLVTAPNYSITVLKNKGKETRSKKQNKEEMSDFRGTKLRKIFKKPSAVMDGVCSQRRRGSNTVRQRQQTKCLPSGRSQQATASSKSALSGSAPSLTHGSPPRPPAQGTRRSHRTHYGDEEADMESKQ